MYKIKKEKAMHFWRVCIQCMHFWRVCLEWAEINAVSFHALWNKCFVPARICWKRVGLYLAMILMGFVQFPASTVSSTLHHLRTKFLKRFSSSSRWELNWYFFYAQIASGWRYVIYTLLKLTRSSVLAQWITTMKIGKRRNICHWQFGTALQFQAHRGRNTWGSWWLCNGFFPKPWSSNLRDYWGAAVIPVPVPTTQRCHPEGQCIGTVPGLRGLEDIFYI